MKKRFRLVQVVVGLALLIALMAVPGVAQADGAAVKTQLGMCLDGSGSIGGSEWDVMTTGLANVIGDPTKVPQDGSVELTVVQFGVNYNQAAVMVPPTVITATSVDGVVDTIKNMAQGGGLTPMAAGIDLCVDRMESSTNIDANTWRVINISSDGAPNVPTDPFGAAEDAVEAAVDAGIDEVDAEAIGVGISESTLEWMRTSLVYPSPGVIVNSGDPYPPRPWELGGCGFVRKVATYDDYAEAIAEKMEVVTEPPEPVPGLNVWGTLMALVAVGGVGILVYRRQTQTA